MHLVKLIGADGKILDQVALVQSTPIALLLLNVISKKRVQLNLTTARRRRVGWNALLAATLAPISLLHGTERRKDSLILTPDLPTAPSQKVENCTELTPCPQGLQHKTLTPAALNQNAEINSAAAYCTEPDGTQPKNCTELKSWDKLSC